MKFSIIIPVYGVERYLRKCVDSVLEAVSAVTCPVEIICVDDGSPDACGTILEEYREKVKKIGEGEQWRGLSFVVIHQQNAGVSVARNRGIEEAKGEWILFVDGDDQMMPETLSFLSDAVKDADFDLLEYGCAEVDAQDVRVPYVPRSIVRYDMQNQGDVTRAFRATRNLLTWNGCFRRSLIGDVRFKKMHPGEDSLFADEMFVRARRIAVTGTVLYRYLQRADSVMHVQRLAPVLCAIQSLRFRFDLLTGWDRYEMIRTDAEKVFLNTAGQISARLRRLGAEDRDIAWGAFVEMGNQVFARSWPYGLLFRMGGKRLIDLSVYHQYVFRKAVVQFRNRFKRW